MPMNPLVMQMKWKHLWNSESKLVLPDGEEVGRVQSFEDGWRGFVGADKVISRVTREYAANFVGGYIRERFTRIALGE